MESCYYCRRTAEEICQPLIQSEILLVNDGTLTRLAGHLCDECAWADEYEPADCDAHDHYQDVCDRNARLLLDYNPRY